MASKSKQYLAYIFERMYYHEIDRRNTLEANLSIPLGVLTIELGLIGVYFREALQFKHHWMMYFYYFLLAFAACFFAIAVFYLFKVLWRKKYAYIDHPRVMKGYWQRYRNHLLKTKRKGNLDGILLREMEDLMLDLWQRGCDNNKTNNDSRAASFWKVKLFMIISIGILLINVLPYIYLRQTQVTEIIQKVQIIDGSQESTHGKKPESSQTPPPETESTTAARSAVHN